MLFGPASFAWLVDYNAGLLGHCEASGIFYTDKVLDGWLVNNYVHRHITFNTAMLIHMYKIKRYKGQLGGIDQLHK